MDFTCCFLGCYLYLQVAVLYNSWKLIKWQDPKWAWAHKDDKRTTLRNFCITWLLITPFAMFLDVGFLWTGVQMAMGPDWIRMINALPVLVIILMATFAKAQFIHMCLLTLQIERLKRRTKKD